jgi:hypothetical protein
VRKEIKESLSIIGIAFGFAIVFICLVALFSGCETKFDIPKDKIIVQYQNRIDTLIYSKQDTLVIMNNKDYYKLEYDLLIMECKYNGLVNCMIPKQCGQTMLYEIYIDPFLIQNKNKLDSLKKLYE